MVIDEKGDRDSEKEASSKNGSPTLCCEVGIESTVCKIDSEAKELVVFRRGGVSTDALKKALAANASTDYTIRVLTKTASHKQHQQAPGQMLTHYAPTVSTFMVANSTSSSALSDPQSLKNSVIIDCGRVLKWTQCAALAYRDLSPQCSMDEAAANLFSTLRWAESIDGATHILLVDVTKDKSLVHEHTEAVRDRMFRAASGNRAILNREANTFSTHNFMQTESDAKSDAVQDKKT